MIHNLIITFPLLFSLWFALCANWKVGHIGQLFRVFLLLSSILALAIIWNEAVISLLT